MWQRFQVDPWQEKASCTQCCKIVLQFKLTVNCPTHPLLVSRVVFPFFLLPVMLLRRQGKVDRGKVG